MRRIIGFALTLVAATSTLSAQRSALRAVRNEGSAGLTFVVAQPLGEFRRNGDVAAGLTGFVVVGFDRMASLGMRIDGQYMVYDSDYRGYGISTTSSIGSLALGPQVTLGQGPIRPYGFATVGGSFFWSSVSVCQWTPRERWAISSVSNFGKRISHIFSICCWRCSLP